MPTVDHDLRIVVQSHQVFVPGVNGMACPTIEKQFTGDGPVTWSYTFTEFEDRLPPRMANVYVVDDQGQVQSGRVIIATPPSTSDCGGKATVTARGMNEALGDRKFDFNVVYGPRWQWEINGGNPVIALSAGDAVIHAVSQLGGSVRNVAAAAELDVTEDFIGRSAPDVVNTMGALRGGLSTPYVWSVRNGSFDWGPLNTAPSYQVVLGDGVELAPSDDASRYYSRVIVLYGKAGRQAVTYPTLVNYQHIPTIVDLVVNAGGEVNDRPAATALAESLYGKLQTLELGWTGTLTITGAGLVRNVGGGPVYPWRVDAQRFIRILGLDSANRYGRDIPDVQLISGARWVGEEDVLTLSLGEMRDPTGLSNLIAHTVNMGNSKPYQAITFPGNSYPVQDAGKLRAVGSPVPPETIYDEQDGGTGAGDHPVPSTQTGFGVTAIDTKQDTVDPTVLPPLPPVVPYQINDADSVGVKGVSWVQPMRLTDYSLKASQACTVTVTGRLVSTGQLLLTLSLVDSAATVGGTTLRPSPFRPITNAVSPLVTAGTPPTYADITAADGILWEVTQADEVNMVEPNWLSIGIASIRYFPHYANKAPVTGGKV